MSGQMRACELSPWPVTLRAPPRSGTHRAERHHVERAVKLGGVDMEDVLAQQRESQGHLPRAVRDIGCG